MDSSESSQRGSGGSVARSSWVSRRGALCLSVAGLLVLCVFFRQCLIAKPWDQTTWMGMKLAWSRLPVAASFMAAGIWGLWLAIGGVFWAALTRLCGALWNEHVYGDWGRLSAMGMGAWCLAGCVVMLLHKVLWPNVGGNWEMRQVGGMAVALGVLAIGCWLGRQSNSRQRARVSRIVSACVLMLIVLSAGVLGSEWLCNGRVPWAPSMAPLYIVGCLAATGLAATLLNMKSQDWESRNQESLRTPGRALTALFLTALMFKGYLAYSWGMLIWYARVPVEWAWAAPLVNGGWLWWGGWTLGCGWLLPCLLMLLPVGRRSLLICRLASLLCLGGGLYEMCWLLAAAAGVREPSALLVGLTALAGLVVGFLMLLSGITFNRKGEA